MGKHRGGAGSTPAARADPGVGASRRARLAHFGPAGVPVPPASLRGGPQRAGWGPASPGSVWRIRFRDSKDGGSLTGDGGEPEDEG